MFRSQPGSETVGDGLDQRRIVGEMQAGCQAGGLFHAGAHSLHRHDDRFRMHSFGLSFANLVGSRSAGGRAARGEMLREGLHLFDGETGGCHGREHLSRLVAAHAGGG